jgi:hypothetical protein
MKLFLVFCFSVAALAFAGCSTSGSGDYSNSFGAGADDPAFHHPRQALVPVAKVYTGNNTPVIRHVLPYSAAQRAGLRTGDEIFSVNGEHFRTAGEYEKYLRKAPRLSRVTFRRTGRLMTVMANLSDDKPRLGAGFEPASVPLVKPNAPLIAYMHVSDVTAYAESTISDNQSELHLNLILESSNPVALAEMNIAVQESGAHKPFAQEHSTVDALGSPRVITKTFRKSGPIKGPVFVSLNIDRKQFRFEFQ